MQAQGIKERWWRFMVRDREDVEGLDASIIMHPAIWKASGHLDTFSDPMSMCKGACRKLMRADQIWEIFDDSPIKAALEPLVGDAGAVANWCKGKGKTLAPGLYAVQHPEHLGALFETLKAAPDARALFTLLATPAGEAPALPCPNCGGVMTEPRPFNLMFKTVVGPIDDPANVAYLRPETAQAIFAEFPNVMVSSRQAPPFGIGQIGKSFRNEVTPRNYIFRSREFEQMELEFFIRPDEAVELLCGRVEPLTEATDLSEPKPEWGWACWHKYWVEQRKQWLVANGLPRDAFVEYWQKPDELAHYARACVDIEYRFPFGTQELEGIAARSDFDLSRHQAHSGKSMEVFDEPLKLAAKKLSDAEKAAFRDKVAADWQSCGKSAEAAHAFVDKLFEGKYIPHVIEPSAGVDRMALALLCEAYEEQRLTDDKGKEDLRTVLHLAPAIAPVKVAVFPLVKNRPELRNLARDIFKLLQKRWNCFWDETGAIGRRYRRQDEIGTPFCVTVDFDTLEKDGTVTVRDRDTMAQERLTLEALIAKIDAAVG